MTLLDEKTFSTQDLCFPLVAIPLKSTSNKLMNLRHSTSSSHFSWTAAKMLQSVVLRGVQLL